MKAVKDEKPVVIKTHMRELEAENKRLKTELGEQKELQHEAQFLSAVIDAIQDGISVLDRDFNILRVNPWMESIYAEQMPLVGQKCYQVYQGSEEICSWCPSIQALQDRQAHTALVPLRSNEKSGWIELSAYPIMGPNGEIRGVIEHVKDVSERVVAENELRTIKEYNESIIRNMHEGIVLDDINGYLTFVNPNAAQTLGYEPEELIGKHWTVIINQDQHHIVQAADQRRSRGKADRYEIELLHKDGSRVPVQVSGTPRHNSKSGEYIGSMAVFTDITQRKQAEAQLNRQLQRLAALRQIDIAITASMDLNVTLNVLLEQTLTQLDIDAASVLLLNPHTQMLEFTAGRGFRTAALSRSRLRLGRGLAGRAALQRKTIGVADLSNQDISFQDDPQFALEDFVAYFGVPLIVKGQVKGVLEAFHRQPIEPSSDWIDFLEALAGQAAIAIDNAELFDRLQRSNMELTLAYNNTLEGWARALELRDYETNGHSQRVTNLALKLAQKMGIPDEELPHIYRGALLHDIGKMGIPDSILHKQGPLSEQEEQIMNQHPVHAYEMLSTVEFLRPALAIPYCHHERWDGTGYPRGIKGNEIPLAARLFAVVDVWDALRSARPYREAWTEQQALEHIRSQAGAHFDPQVVEAFLAVIDS